MLIRIELENLRSTDVQSCNSLFKKILGIIKKKKLNELRRKKQDVVFNIVNNSTVIGFRGQFFTFNFSSLTYTIKYDISLQIY